MHGVFIHHLAVLTLLMYAYLLSYCCFFHIQNWEKIKKLSKVIGDLNSMNLPVNEDQDICDIQHLGRETVVLDEDGIEKNGVILDDRLPLVIDNDHDIIPNNAKVLNS